MGALVLASARLQARRMHDSGDENDEALIARAGGGDRAAFAALFQRFAGRVKAYLMRLGAPAQAAEDLAQEAMLAIWRKASTFEASRAKATTWIFVIARNAWIDRLRREKVELAYRATLFDVETSTDEAPDEAAARAEAANAMQAALATLSYEQRQVVQLSFFEERPHSEIAQRLSLPLGTVKSRLRLALARLRAHWEQLA